MENFKGLTNAWIILAFASKAIFVWDAQAAIWMFIWFLNIRVWQHFYTKYFLEEPTLELAARKIKVAGHEFVSQSKDNELFRLAQTIPFLQTKVEFLSSSNEEHKKKISVLEKLIYRRNIVYIISSVILAILFLL